MKTYRLTLSPDYVADWTIEDALRELFQNAIDTDDWDWSVNEDKELMIMNEGIMTFSSMLVGHSSKRMDNQSIGSFGEGYKLACLVLAREGRPVEIRTGHNIWRPVIRHDHEFHSDLLHFDVEHEPFFPDGKTQVIIQGLTSVDLLQAQAMILPMRERHEPIKVFYNTRFGRILNDGGGNVYVKGLRVTDKSGLKYSYDFKPEHLTLDRDRRMVRDFDLQWTTSQLWAGIYDKAKSVINTMLQQGAKDIQHLDSFLRGDKVTKDVYARPLRRGAQFAGGDPSKGFKVPVSSESERQHFEGKYNVQTEIKPAVLCKLIHGSKIFREVLASLERKDDRSPLAQLQEFSKRHGWCLGDDGKLELARIIRNAEKWR